jgi:hypothetical protein
MKRRFYNKTNLNWNRMETLTDDYYTDMLATSFEVPTNQWWKIGNKFFGWFIAPETTSYRFHMNCDDYCDLDMGLNVSDPLNTTKLIERRWVADHRSHWNLINDHKSEWLNLTAGEKYYMYSKHYESHGNDHFVVGVEINQTSMVNHHHSMKEIQLIEAYVENATQEVTRVTQTKPNAGGNYYLSFQIPENLTYWTSGKIPAAASADELRNAVKNYYWLMFRSEIDVNMTMYLANGTNTTNVTEAETYVYNIIVRKLIADSSVANIISTSPKATVELPSAVQLSSKPLSGKFMITCPLENNDVATVPITTAEIPYEDYRSHVERALFYKCQGAYEKLDLWDS